MKTRKTKKLLIIIITLILLTVSITPVSTFAQTPTLQDNALPNNHMQTITAQPHYWEGAIAHFYPNTGAAMQFTGDRLTAVSNARVLTGSYKSITICLVYDLPLYPVVKGTTTTIYPDGQSYTLFRDIIITPGASYRLQYVVNTSNGNDTAEISTGLASRTY